MNRSFDTYLLGLLFTIFAAVIEAGGKLKHIDLRFLDLFNQ